MSFLCAAEVVSVLAVSLGAWVKRVTWGNIISKKTIHGYFGL